MLRKSSVEGGKEQKGEDKHRHLPAGLLTDWREQSFNENLVGDNKRSLTWGKSSRFIYRATAGNQWRLKLGFVRT